ncbi:hypothetical protein L580_1515 [Serratia fonticola AU-P3(3)]|nr:hypothetical protein L580_1515 [Serratia fonticola AU-P3(3)]
MQAVLAQLLWYNHPVKLDKPTHPEDCRWYVCRQSYRTQLIV